VTLTYMIMITSPLYHCLWENIYHLLDVWYMYVCVYCQWCKMHTKYKKYDSFFNS